MADQGELKKRRGCLWWVGLAAVAFVVLIILVVVLAAVASDSDDEDSDGNGDERPAATDGSRSQLEEVTITTCERDAVTGFINVNGTAENTSSSRSDYIIDISIESPDGATKFDTANAIATGVEPGQTANWESGALQEVTGEFVCKVADVERNASL